MTNDDIVKAIIEQRSDQKALTVAIEHLARSLEGETKKTNEKLDKIVESISKQALIGEKVEGIENRLKDSFERIHTRLESVEDDHKGEGCPALKIAKAEGGDMEKRLDSLEDSRTWVVRRVIGIILALIASAFSALLYFLKGG